MLAWIDLEATGLVAGKHAVLEVAAIVTDDQLCEVGRFQRVVHWPRAARLAHLGPESTPEEVEIAAASTEVDRVVVELHAKGGLWAESAASAHDLIAVDDQLAEFLAKTSIGKDGQKAQIAGSSIWLDRSFMAVSLPRSLGQLHYRCVDVTTLNELARRHRQRRRARQRLWDVQKELAERQVDLVSYERVIVDMTTKRQLAPWGGAHAIELVTMCRNVTRTDCERLSKAVEDLARAVKDLEPKQEATACP